MRLIRSFALALGLTAALSLSASVQTAIAKLDGGTVDLRSQNGKVVVLALGASWLPLSAKQAEYLNSLAKSHAGKNVAFYYVVTDSTNAKSKNFASDEVVRKFVAANKISVPVLRDSDGAVILKAFKVDQVPSFIVIDKKGEQAGEAFGGIDPKFDVTVPVSQRITSVL